MAGMEPRQHVCGRRNLFFADWFHRDSVSQYALGDSVNFWGLTCNYHGTAFWPVSQRAAGYACMGLQQSSHEFYGTGLSELLFSLDLCVLSGHLGRQAAAIESVSGKGFFY